MQRVSTFMRMLLTSVRDVFMQQLLTLFGHGWTFTVRQAIQKVLTPWRRVRTFTVQRVMRQVLTLSGAAGCPSCRRSRRPGRCAPRARLDVQALLQDPSFRASLLDQDSAEEARSDQSAEIEPAGHARLFRRYAPSLRTRQLLIDYQ